MSLKDNLHVMVVDDMSTSRGLIIMALESIGLVNINFTKDGAEAFRAIAAKPVHLVISDFNMPNMDGLQLLQSLRGYAQTKSIGFILVTGRADADLINKGRALGMNNFIKKPFTPEGMKGCIEAVVGKL